MDNSIMPTNNIESEIQQIGNPLDIANQLLPRLECQLEMASSTNESNEIRAKIKTVETYLKRKLPSIVSERGERYKHTHRAAMDFIEASAKAGAFWSALDNKRPEGRPSENSENYQSYLDWQQAGFTSPRDATTCTRISKLHTEDLRTYFDECLINLKEPTLYGAERVWHMLNNIPHVSNNSGENEWYTPKRYIDAVYEVMGHIDLDPASSEIANEVVNADTFYTISENGLDYVWHGKTWLNPPYAGDLVSAFIDKLIDHVNTGDIPEAIVLVNNATETAWFRKLVSVASAITFTYSRIKYWRPDGEMNAPLQGQAFIYIGENVKRFSDVFNQMGWVAYVDNSHDRI